MSHDLRCSKCDKPVGKFPIQGAWLHGLVLPDFVCEVCGKQSPLRPNKQPDVIFEADYVVDRVYKERSMEIGSVENHSTATLKRKRMSDGTIVAVPKLEELKIKMDVWLEDEMLDVGDEVKMLLSLEKKK